jgi:hypothetical protein
MKRCPKCGRTYQDDNQKFCTTDGGLLVGSDQPFDPNATIQSSSSGFAETRALGDSAPLGETRDLNATVIAGPSAPTTAFPKQTGPTPPPFPQAPSAPLTPTPQSLSGSLPQTGSLPPPVAVAPAKKKSKLPLVLGIVALLLVLGVGAVAAVFFLVIKPRLDEAQPERPVVTRSNPSENLNANENVNTNTTEVPAEPEFVAPPNATRFTNSQATLDGKLAEHYFDFSFYYPQTWVTDPKAGVAGASNFAKVERRLPPDFTQENFAVGWYTSKGTFAADEATYPQLVEILGSSLAKGFPEYRKVSEGPTKVNSLDGYEFRFESVSRGTEKGDITLWGRVVFLPSGVAGDQTGATLIMLATSLAPELSGVADVGEKGEMPVILQTFRFGK